MYQKITTAISIVILTMSMIGYQNCSSSKFSVGDLPVNPEALPASTAIQENMPTPNENNEISSAISSNEKKCALLDGTINDGEYKTLYLNKNVPSISSCIGKQYQCLNGVLRQVLSYESAPKGIYRYSSCSTDIPLVFYTKSNKATIKLQKKTFDSLDLNGSAQFPTGCYVQSRSLFCGSASPETRYVGDGKTTSKNVFVKILSANTNMHFESGYSSNCAIADEALYCWGGYLSDIFLSTTPLIGDGTIKSQKSPTLIFSSGVKKVRLGYLHTCALVYNDLYCWGTGTAVGSSKSYEDSPKRILQNVTDFDANEYSTCANVDEKLICWGYINDEFPASEKTILNRPINSKIQKVTVSDDGVCVLIGGTVYCNKYTRDSSSNLSLIRMDKLIPINWNTSHVIDVQFSPELMTLSDKGVLARFHKEYFLSFANYGNYPDEYSENYSKIIHYKSNPTMNFLQSATILQMNDGSYVYDFKYTYKNIPTGISEFQLGR